MKKLLFITFILFTTLSFAQQNERSNGIVKKEVQISLTSITASPNPFNIRTTIRFESSENRLVQFSVKNLLGKTVYSQVVNARVGLNKLNFDKNDITKGIYIYSLQSGNQIVSKRLIIK